MDKTSLLTIKNLSFAYPKDNEGTINSIHIDSLNLKENDVFAITGPSGCGKSTLLECIGLLRQEVEFEEFKLEDLDIKELKPKQHEALRSSQIGFMPQTGGLIPFLKIIDNLKLQIEVASKSLFKLEGKTLNQEGLLDSIVEDLKEFGLGKYLNAYPHQLSIGQRQRAVFFKSLCHQPKLLLIDEPTSALDPEHGKMLFDTMIKVCQSKRVASLVVTHDLNLVHEFNLRQVTIMHNGNFKQEKS